jgi:CRP/FNR family transcriptional regulator, cyclic AMP receptor protein
MGGVDPARLNAIPLFSSLSKKECSKVAQLADEVDVPEGKELVREGDFAYEFFAIEQGRAEVRHGEEVLAELGPGDFFGEAGALQRLERNADVVAKSQMALIVLTARDLRHLADDMPELGARLNQALEERCSQVVAAA